MRVKRSVALLVVAVACVAWFGSCKKFVFFDRTVSDDKNPHLQKKMPRTSADLFKPPIVTDTDLPNPDKGGALDDWATCLIMVKEGHPHMGGKMHGNFVYPGAPWKQEEFVVVHNRKDGIKVEVDRSSTVTNLEAKRGKQGPDYIRIIAGGIKLWGFCFYFYDRQGNLLNDKILDNSGEYQIFFSISDVDDKGKPYDVLDVRYRGSGEDEKPIPAAFFKDKASFEERRRVSPMIFYYTYRDTWQHDDMGDGVRNYFNIRLLPPFSRYDYEGAKYKDVDCVGLKGHFAFDTYDSQKETWIDAKDWPVKLSDGISNYGGISGKRTGLLPQFYLAVRVMKCPKGKKVVTFTNHKTGESYRSCAYFHHPREESEWTELIRMNIPIKMYTNADESDPTNPDCNEPYYYQLGREIGLTPRESFEAISNLITHADGGAGGLGFGAWFL